MLAHGLPGHQQGIQRTIQLLVREPLVVHVLRPVHETAVACLLIDVDYPGRCAVLSIRVMTLIEGHAFQTLQTQARPRRIWHVA
jgi:hypothetical protein